MKEHDLDDSPRSQIAGSGVAMDRRQASGSRCLSWFHLDEKLAPGTKRARRVVRCARKTLYVAFPLL